MGVNIFALIFIIAFIASPFLRLFVKSIHLIWFYGLKDLILYFVEKRWRRFNKFGIDMWIGMFGHGKTLSMSHRAEQIYKQFGDSIRFISNYKLNNIPYIPLLNFEQLVDLGEEQESKYQATVVLIDEVENLLSHRNFANFPLELLHMLTQQRKKRVYIMCSAQRFFMVDKLWRSITTNIYDCNKTWRFQHMELYDAWDYENAMNPKLIQRSANIWWFVRNKDYEAYDTSEMIMKSAAEDFISNDEAIQRKGLDNMVNEQAIRKPNKKRVKQLNKRKK